MTTPIDKAQLRALAEAATPGPWAFQGQDKARSIWTADGWHVVVNASASAKCGREGDYYDCQTASATCRTTLSEANAKYITAVSPDVLRALLDELATQAAQIEACRAEAADAKRYRWLRDGPDEWSPFDSSWLVKNDIYGCPTLAMDVAIDAAIALKEKTP